MDKLIQLKEQLNKAVQDNDIDTVDELAREINWWISNDPVVIAHRILNPEVHETVCFPGEAYYQTHRYVQENVFTVNTNMNGSMVIVYTPEVINGACIHILKHDSLNLKSQDLKSFLSGKSLFESPGYEGYTIQTLDCASELRNGPSAINICETVKDSNVGIFTGRVDYAKSEVSQNVFSVESAVVDVTNLLFKDFNKLVQYGGKSYSSVDGIRGIYVPSMHKNFEFRKHTDIPNPLYSLVFALNFNKPGVRSVQIIVTRHLEIIPRHEYMELLSPETNESTVDMNQIIGLASIVRKQIHTDEGGLITKALKKNI